MLPSAQETHTWEGLTRYALSPKYSCSSSSTVATMACTWSSGMPWSSSPKCSIVGAFELSKRTVLVERTLGVGTDSQLRVDSQLRLGILRDGLLQPWADFPEPRRPWSIGPFGGSAMVLELGDRGRASTRMLSFSAFAPDALATELLPPGFASGSWIHMPIIGALSMALVLAAMGWHLMTGVPLVPLPQVNVQAVERLELWVPEVERG